MTKAPVTIRDLLTMQVALLAEIRDALVAEVAESNDCPHPEEQRVSLSSFGDADHWVCGVCKYDNKAGTMN